jgi:hypothetical protein
MGLDHDSAAVAQAQAGYGTDARAVKQGLNGVAAKLAIAELIKSMCDGLSVTGSIDGELDMRDIPLTEMRGERRNDR